MHAIREQFNDLSVATQHHEFIEIESSCSKIGKKYTISVIIRFTNTARVRVISGNLGIVSKVNPELRFKKYLVLEVCPEPLYYVCLSVRPSVTFAVSGRATKNKFTHPCV